MEELPGCLLQQIVPGTNTSYLWTIPDTPTTLGLVQVIGYDSSGNQISDKSDLYFEISKPVVTVISPNGGENWYVNATHPITWSSSNLTASNYSIQYSIDGGVTWIPVAINVPGTSTSYPWTVPDTPTTQGLVQVIGYGSSGIQIPDQSDSPFIISKPVVTVTSPNGGENWYVNSSYPITWSSSNLTVANYTILYSTDGGVTWQPVAVNVPGTNTSYPWTIPDTPTTQGLIKLIGIDSNGDQITDQSNSYFTIAKTGDNCPVSERW